MYFQCFWKFDFLNIFQVLNRKGTEFRKKNNGSNKIHCYLESRGVFRTLQKSILWLLPKKSQWVKAVKYFCKNLHHTQSPGFKIQKNLRCSIKKLLLNILENSQENICAWASACNFIKKRLWHRCFSLNFAKVLRTPILQNNSKSLLL